MIIAKLAAATLVMSVAAGPDVEPSAVRLSMQQKNAATQVYVRSATECIARTVAADARFRKDAPASNLGELMRRLVRAMIAAYDRYFGEGVGEEFFIRSRRQRSRDNGGQGGLTRGGALAPETGPAHARHDLPGRRHDQGEAHQSRHVRDAGSRAALAYYTGVSASCRSSAKRTACCSSAGSATSASS